jgi:D-lactate dehydrogenase (cytochrome)
VPLPPSPASTLPLHALPAPRHKLAPTNLEASWADFVAVVGDANVCTREAQAALEDDGRRVGAAPFLIIYPASTEEVAACMKICHARRIPVLGYRGGVSVEEHFRAEGGGIQIDFSRMNRISALQKDDLQISVQPGVRLEALSERLSSDGLSLPTSASGAMFGNVIAAGNNGSGGHRANTVADWVSNLTVVLADGTVIQTHQPGSANLTNTFIGSGGSLGLVTEVTLQLAVAPAATSVARAVFASVRHAADCAAAIAASGIPVAAIQLLDVDDHSACSLRLCFEGTAASVAEQVEAARALVRSRPAPCTSWELAGNDKYALDCIDGVVAVPMSRLAEALEWTRADLARGGLAASLAGCVVRGEFHGQSVDTALAGADCDSYY